MSYQARVTVCVTLTALTLTALGGWLLGAHPTSRAKSQLAQNHSPASADIPPESVARRGGEQAEVPEASPDAGVATHARTEALHGRIDRLTEQLQTLQSAIGAMSKRDEPDGTLDQPVTELSAQDLSETDGRGIDQELLAYENAFNGELLDPDWSAEAEARLYDAIASIDSPELGGSQARCGSTLCEVRLSWANEAAFVDGYAVLLDRLGWRGDNIVVYDPSLGEAVIYMAREEYRPPSVAEGKNAL